MNRDNTILIVAGSDAPWSEFSGLLTQRYGYRVLRASSGSEAKTIARRVHVDLAIAEDDASRSNGVDF